MATTVAIYRLCVDGDMEHCLIPIIATVRAVATDCIVFVGFSLSTTTITHRCTQFNEILQVHVSCQPHELYLISRL